MNEFKINTFAGGDTLDHIFYTIVPFDCLCYFELHRDTQGRDEHFGCYI